MKAEIGKYYIVSEENKLIVDLGLIEVETTIETMKTINKFDNEDDYTNFLNQLEKEAENV